MPIINVVISFSLDGFKSNAVLSYMDEAKLLLSKIC